MYRHVDSSEVTADVSAKIANLVSTASVVYAFSMSGVGGNPAGVVVNEPSTSITLTVQKAVASLLNFPETAFVERKSATDCTSSDREGNIERCAIRWFTPNGSEVDLCGHATMAAAHEILRNDSSKTLIFETRFAGEVIVRSSEEGYRMEFPEVHLEYNAQICRESRASFNCYFTKELASPCPLELLGRTSLGDLVAFGDTQEDIENLIVSEVRAALLTLESAGEPRKAFSAIRGLIVVVKTPRYGSTYDFASRFFAPHIGIDEDPCTGSAHCFLGPYMSRILGKVRVAGRQLGPGGGGLVICEPLEAGRVALYGECRRKPSKLPSSREQIPSVECTAPADAQHGRSGMT